MGTTLCAYVLFMTFPSTSPSISDWTADRQDVTRGILDPDVYDKRVRPSGDDMATTLVEMSFFPVNINALDTVTQTMTMTAWLLIGWNDDRLTWNEEDTDDVTMVVPQDEIWRPDVGLHNSFTDIKALGNKNMYVTIDSDGWVQWYPYQVFQSNCALDTRHFPFDIQTCEMHFSAWSFIDTQVHFADGHYIDMTNYQPNNQFDVISYTAEHQVIEDTSVVIYKFIQQRKPHFVVMTTVVPIVTLALLSICVFILPFDSGEKIGYSVTVFLAFMVTLTYVSTILPENSETISYLAVYVTSQVAQSTLQTFVTIILCRLYNFDENVRSIPRAFLLLKGKFCCAKKKKPNCITPLNVGYDEKSVSNQNTSKNRQCDSSLSLVQYSGSESNGMHIVSSSYSVANIDVGDKQGQFDACPNIYSVAGDCQAECDSDGESLKISEEEKEEETTTWKTVVNELDAFCFVFFLLLCIVCTAVYIFAASFHI